MKRLEEVISYETLCTKDNSYPSDNGMLCGYKMKGYGVTCDYLIDERYCKRYNGSMPKVVISEIIPKYRTNH